MRRLVALMLAAVTLAGCAGGLCWRDNSGVERHPDSRAPDAHTGH